MNSLYSQTFEQLGRESGTDKTSRHGYQRFYPRFLDPMRPTLGGMLEIGIEEGRSVRMWEQYFPKAFIYGLDKGKESQSSRSRIFKADQSSVHDLNRVITSIQHSIHFILDDGSHIPEHQLLTFDLFFRTLLQPGGVYIIEDIETSYWTQNGLYGYMTRYGYHHPKSVVELCKPLIDDVNAEYLTSTSKSHQDVYAQGFHPDTRRWISSITFGQNCIIFTKKTVEELATYTRPYLFNQNL